MILSIFIFIITLLSLVLIHELGHFLMAKKFCIKVEEFGFGIPPKVWGKKIGETLVSINLLPFGGFVRLFGEDVPNDKAEKQKVLESTRSFAHRSVWQRIIVVVAGVFMNFALACLIFYITLSSAGFKFQVPLLTEHQFLGVLQKTETFVVVTNVFKDSPAQKADLKTGEQIIAVNNQPVTDGQQLIDETKSQAGKEVNLTVLLENKEKKEIKVLARQDPPKGQGPLGIAMTSFKLADLEYKTLPEKIFAGPLHSINLTIYSGKVLGKTIGQAFTKKNFEPLSNTVSGPIGIGAVANDILTKSAKPLLSYIDFIGLISLNLAIINLLPIPAMDGGRLFFLLIEALSGRRVHADFERWVHTIGMIVLLSIGILITFSDIGKLFS